MYFTFTQEFKNWLMEIIYQLISLEEYSNGKRICSGLLLLCLLHNLAKHFREIDASDISTIFSMLLLKPTIEQSKPKCEDLRMLNTLISIHYQEYVANILVDLVNFILPVREVCVDCQWLHVIPLIHIFKRKILKPLYETQLSWLGDDGIELSVLKRNSCILTSR